MRFPGIKPYLAGIRTYPIKSLDPLEAKQIRLFATLRLAGDREYALFDEQGQVLNGKRLQSKILSVRADYSLNGRIVDLAAGSESKQFRLPVDRKGIEAWLAGALGQNVSLQQNPIVGFPDDEHAYGPTVIGTASIEAVAKWFSLSAEEVRRRFRANLEIAGLEPFEEDTLFGPPGQPKRFRIGAVEFLGINPCRRCVVPTLDSRGDEAVRPLSTKDFSELRQRHAREDTSLAQYSGHYRLAVNTLIAPDQAGEQLRIGDELATLG